MDSLRWVLLIIGVAVVAAVAAFTLWQKQRNRSAETELREWPHDTADKPTYDDLPSLEQLEAARHQHAAEGTDLPPLDTDVMEEIRAADVEREARQQGEAPRSTNSDPSLNAGVHANNESPSPYLDGLKEHLRAEPNIESQAEPQAVVSHEPTQTEHPTEPEAEGSVESQGEPRLGTTVGVDAMADDAKRSPQLSATESVAMNGDQQRPDPSFGTAPREQPKAAKSERAESSSGNDSQSRPEQREVSAADEPLQTGLFGEDDSQSAPADEPLATRSAPASTKPKEASKPSPPTRPAEDRESVEKTAEAPQKTATEEAEMIARAARQRVEEAARLRQEKVAEPTPRRATMHSTDLPAADSSQAAREASTKEPSETPKEKEEVVVLYLKAEDSIGLYGPEIARCLEAMGFKHGEMGIYHYQSAGQRIVSVANIEKPGTFDPDNMTGMTTPGLALFLQLRAESDFEFSQQVLVKSAKYMAGQLKATVLDSNRKPLDAKGEQALRLRISTLQSELQEASGRS